MTDLDQLWLLLATALVLLMQGGFLLLEAGMTRTKNYINVAVKNLADLGIAVLLFWLVGYGLMFGTDRGGLIGLSDFAVDLTTVSPDVTVFFLFQMVFAGTTVTIISGAIAERTAFTGYVGIVLTMAVVYPIFGHWVWGDGGWLGGLGFVDFAGSTVVHSMGGWAALAAAIAVTIIGGASGLVASLLGTWRRHGYPVPTAPLNGALAGLVAVTAGPHALSVISAVLVGAIGAAVGLWVEGFIERKGVDDAVGAIPVHLGAGIWGTLAVGIFGRQDSLGTDLGRVSQIGVQALGITAAALWGFCICWVLFRWINSVTPLRVIAEHEDEGLNVAEHNEPSALIELLSHIEHQARTGAITEPIASESFTEVGQIADQFNTLTAELRSMAELAEKIAAGQLDVQVMPRSDQDLFGLAFRRMVRDLRSTVRGIASTATELTRSAASLGELADEVEKGVDVQHDSITRSERAFDEVEGLIDQLVTEAERLAASTGNALDGLAAKMDNSHRSKTGSATLTDDGDGDGDGDDDGQADAGSDKTDIRQAVRAIEGSADQISSIVGAVQSIADTTNLLALNAHIESARAGEHGSAFAIVANEVRDLATETMNALEEMERLIADLQSKASGAVGIVDSVVGDVGALASDFATITTGVDRAAQNLKAQANEAKQAIESIGEVSQRNASVASEFKELSQAVEHEAGNVEQQLARFET